LRTRSFLGLLANRFLVDLAEFRAAPLVKALAGTDRNAL